MTFDPDQSIPPGANIKVIGVGGGGGNAVNTMIRANLEGVDFISANTDVQALRFSLSEKKIQVGKELTKGLGAGADPDIGRDAALEDRHEIQEMIGGADMVFITAGMGGGTGTGGASVIAQIAREMGALTVAVVTKPFNFEGKRRRKHAESGIEKLRENVDTLITIPNQRLLQIATPDLSMVDAFRMADEVLLNAVKGISDIINVPGTVNVDFADVKTVMSSMGMALMGIGRAQGETRAVDAARQAICSPLLEDIDIEGATGILINITAGTNISLMEVNEACSIVQDAAHEDANIIFGAVIDENVGDEIRVTVIATGFPADYEETDDIRNVQQAVATPRSFTAGIFGAGQSTEPQPPARPKAPVSEARIPAPPAFRQAPVTTPAPAAEPAVPAPAPAPVATQPVMPSATIEEPVSASFQEEAAEVPMSEAEDLTRMTMQQPDELQNFAPVEERQGAITHDPVVTAAHVEEPLVETPVLEEPKVAAPMSSPFLDDDEFEEDEEADSLVVPPPPQAPMDSMFASESTPAAENQAMDQKIDEALELAERIKNHEGFSGDDDLDIPAFLRDGMKDLSLD